jgi:hypothetical protein
MILPSYSSTKNPYLFSFNEEGRIKLTETGKGETRYKPLPRREEQTL